MTTPASQPTERRRILRLHHVLTVAALVLLTGLVVFMNVGLYETVRKNQAEYINWGPRRVADHYGRCLDARFGLKPTLLGSERHDTRAVQLGLRNGSFTNRQVDAWLEALHCSPLPEAAYNYRPEGQ